MQYSNTILRTERGTVWRFHLTALRSISLKTGLGKLALLSGTVSWSLPVSLRGLLLLHVLPSLRQTWKQAELNRHQFLFYTSRSGYSCKNTKPGTCAEAPLAGTNNHRLNCRDGLPSGFLTQQLVGMEGTGNLIKVPRFPLQDFQPTELS